MSAAAPRWVGLAMARLSGYWRELHPLPIARTLKSYSLGDFKRDVRAGSVVAALSIPQCMAYALIAGLPPQNGLYAAVAGGFLGALFGSSNHLVTEPSNATAIVLGSAFLQFHGQINPLTAVLTVTFLVGLFQLVAGMSKLGNLTQYVSRSVIIGYTSAAAILIATGQVHNLLGFDLHASSFYDLCVKTFTNLDQTQWGCLAWGLFGIAVMLGVRRWYPKFPTVLAFLLLSGVLVYFFHLDQLGGMALLDEVPAGGPSLSLPPMDLTTVRWMAGVALAISVFSALEASAISKTIAASSGQMVNTNQELIGLGTGNLASAIVGGMPISGSLTRSFLNFDLGASTRISSLVSSSIVLVLIIFAGPMTRFVPKVALAAHLLVVSAQIISPRLITFAVRSTRADAAVFFVTFLSTLFLPLEIAIYLGVGMSLALFLHKVSAPQLVEYAFSEEGSLKEIDSPQKRSHAQISIIHVEGELFFGAADVFSNQIRRICEQQNLKVVILRMKNARNLDASGAMALDSLLDYLQQKNRYLIMSGVTPKVMRVLERSGLVEKLGRENVFLAEQSLNASTRNALKRALSIVAATASDIRIFFNPGQRVGPATEEASSWTFEI